MATYLIVVVILAAFSNAGLANPVRNKKQKLELIESVVLTNDLKGFNGTWISDTEFITSSNMEIQVFDVISKTFRKLLSLRPKWMGAEYTFSPDNKKILVRYDVESIFRHSIVAKYDIYDLETKQTHEIGNNKKLQLCVWSPTSDRLVYVMDNNVYVRQPDGTEEKLTTEGKNGVIYIGVPDWVYEEEVLGSGGALWFSPDGEKVAVAYFDDTNVETYTYQMYGDPEDFDNQYPKELNLRYPKPGTPNPKVQLKVIDLKSTSKGWTELKAPESIVTKDNILKTVTWSDSDHVLAIWQNRRQNLASLQLCGLSGECREVANLVEPDGWIMVGDPKCYSENNCLMTNWIGNWYQIWNLDLKTGKNVWDSMGNITVQKMYGYKKSSNELYYQATTKEDVSEIHIYKNGNCLSCSLKDADGEPCKHAEASFSKGFSYYAVTCAGPTIPYTILFESETQKPIVNWESNKNVKESVDKYLLPKKQIIQVPTGDGLTASVKLFLPPDINLDSPDESKKYPLIIEVYGGPNHVRVKNGFAVGLPDYYSASRDVVYALIDPRGSGNKGKQSLYILNNHLGTTEIEDEYTVAKYLREKYKFIDPHRGGIWGWSYGGFTAALTIARDNETVFSCGVSVAPVVNWIYYDSIYTERFMGLPTKEDNLINYNRSSATANVGNFRKHGYLLVHGSGDDNVHVQQTMMLARALQKADILFEEMIYPDEAHGISSLRRHVWRTIEDFWNRCLKLPPLEKN